MGERNEGICLVEGNGELILEFTVGTDVCHGLKVAQINNSAKFVTCLMTPTRF